MTFVFYLTENLLTVRVVWENPFSYLGNILNIVVTIKLGRPFTSISYSYRKTLQSLVLFLSFSYNYLCVVHVIL